MPFFACKCARQSRVRNNDCTFESDKLIDCYYAKYYYYYLRQVLKYETNLSGNLDY